MNHTPTTLILCGTSETIPSDILELLLAQARGGRGRLMIVDEGSQLACLHAARDADLLLDPAIGTGTSLRTTSLSMSSGAPAKQF